MAIKENQERIQFITKIRSILAHDLQRDQSMFFASATSNCINFVKRIISAIKKEIDGVDINSVNNFSQRELEIHQRTKSLTDLLLQFEDSAFTKKLDRKEALNIALSTVLINPEFDINSERNAHKRYAIKALILESKGFYDSIQQLEPVPVYEENLVFNHGLI